ncbi:hypothetical protein SAMN05421806_1076, partial [Streptomyces indicus]
SSCSPCTRGWTRHLHHAQRPAELLPVHAGMDPSRRARRGRSCPAPRARGDGPVESRGGDGVVVCPPCTRGWTPRRLADVLRGRLLPVHAGMDPGPSSRTPRRSTTPRARGDGPALTTKWDGLPPCSPRTRGWTPRTTREKARNALLPAHTGMDPSTAPSSASSASAPRTRGDGPCHEQAAAGSDDCSPCTRGWTRAERGPAGRDHLLPVHAGMDPSFRRRRRARSAPPRARGDGPTGCRTRRVRTAWVAFAGRGAPGSSCRSRAVDQRKYPSRRSAHGRGDGAGFALDRPPSSGVCAGGSPASDASVHHLVPAHRQAPATVNLGCRQVPDAVRDPGALRSRTCGPWASSVHARK